MPLFLLIIKTEKPEKEPAAHDLVIDGTQKKETANKKDDKFELGGGFKGKIVLP